MLMKKLGILRIVACVIVSFSACQSHAQSSITLYGIADAGVLYVNKTTPSTMPGHDTGSQIVLNDSGLQASRIGLRGVEDIGGGMQVTFKLESGISLASGGFNNSNGNLFGRDAWIALDGRFGEVKTGLQESPFFLATYAIDPRTDTLFGSSVVSYVDNVIATGINNPSAISYTTPIIGGFSGSAMIAFGGEPGNFQAGRQYSGSLRYFNGSLLIVAAIYDGNSGGTVQTQIPIPSTVEFEGRTVGASYTIQGLTVKASFANYKVAGSFNNNVYGAGFDYLVNQQIDLNGGVWITSDRNDTSNNSILTALGAYYYLSKRTTLYTQVGLVNNHGAMNTGLSVSNSNSALYEAPGTTVGANIGIRHTF
jgi:predicted porin